MSFKSVLGLSFSIIAIAGCASSGNGVRKISSNGDFSYTCYQKGNLRNQMKVSADRFPSPGVSIELWLHPQRSDTRGHFVADTDAYSREATADGNMLNFRRTNLYGSSELTENVKVDWASMAAKKPEASIEIPSDRAGEPAQIFQCELD